MNSPYWFELAVMFGLFGIGNIVFGHFAAGTPKWWRVTKVLLAGALGVAVSAAAGREWFFALLGVMAAAVAVVHAWWLPRHGIYVWRADAKDKYYALRGWPVKAR